MARKVYVEVVAKFDADGQIFPVSLRWEDGTVYEIDQILSSCRRASIKAGGIGIRYTCQISGRQRYLYYEEPRWFVEAKE